MSKNKGKIMITIVLCALALVGVGVCSMVAKNRNNNPPVCGGTTDETDYKAPKVIKSRV